MSLTQLQLQLIFLVSCNCIEGFCLKFQNISLAGKQDISSAWLVDSWIQWELIIRGRNINYCFGFWLPQAARNCFMVKALFNLFLFFLHLSQNLVWDKQALLPLGYMKLPNTPFILLSNTLEAPFNLTWNTLETFLKHHWHFPETSLKHPLNVLETFCKHPWNFQTPFLFPKNFLETLLKLPWNTL